MKIHPDLWWNMTILGNTDAEDLIDDYLEKKESLTLEEMKKLVKNPNVKYLSYIDVRRYPILVPDLCSHPSQEAIEMIRDLDTKNWSNLSSNPYAISLLRENPSKIDYARLADNPAAYELLKECVTKRRLGHFALLSILSGQHAQRLYQEVPNSFPDSVIYHSPKLLSVRRERFGENTFTRKEICSHPDWLGDILLMGLDQWDVGGLVSNPNPEVELLLLALLESRELSEQEIEEIATSRYPEVLRRALDRYDNQIDRSILSENAAAIDLLLEDMSLVRWDTLAVNPSERVIEVVLKYKYSFLASKPYHDGMYLRKEVLVEDKQRYKKKVKEKVKFFSHY
jgi:hypothetical protein